MIAAEALTKIAADLDAQIDPHLATKLAEYTAAGALAADLAVTDAGSLQVANECLRLVVTEKDGLEAVRESGPGALGGIVRKLNAKFKPLRDLLEVAESNLKHAIGSYTLAQRLQQQQGYQAAALAHAQGAHAAAQSALAVASAAQTSTPQGTGVRAVWTVKRIAADMLPREWLVPDEARIHAHAKATPADQQPYPIPGVTFELGAEVSVRR
jgi:hypothetical protein